jgi:hypothetical protein
MVLNEFIRKIRQLKWGKSYDRKNAIYRNSDIKKNY